MVILDQMHPKREREGGGSRWPNVTCDAEEDNWSSERAGEIGSVVDQVGWLVGRSGCVTKRNGTSQKPGAYCLSRNRCSRPVAVDYTFAISALHL